MTAKAPSLPGPSATETALQQQQLVLLEKQSAQLDKQQKTFDLLSPILYKSAGVQPEYDEKGDIKGFSQISDPTSALKSQVEQGFYKRTLDALQGKLDVNPGLVQQLAEREQQLREGLRKNLGPGYETSTPGIEALKKFETEKSNILEGARRGDLTTFEQLGLAQSSGTLAGQAQQFGMATGLANNPLASAGAYGAAAGSTGSAAGLLANERLGQYSANLNSYNASQKTLGSLLGGVGQLGGLALFGPTNNLFGSLFKSGATASVPTPGYGSWY